MIVNVKVPVNGGCILMSDYDEYGHMLGDDPTRLEIHDIELKPVTVGSCPLGPARISMPPGHYSIVYKSLGFGPKVENSIRMHIPSGKLLIADMCHVVEPHKWTEIMEITECFGRFKNPSRCHLIDTYGSEIFNLNLVIKPLQAQAKEVQDSVQ